MNVNRSSMLTANLHNNKEGSLNSLLISNASLKRKSLWVKIQLYRTKYLENQSKKLSAPRHVLPCIYTVFTGILYQQ